MNYTLVNNTPEKLNIEFKETISALINNLYENLPVTDKNVIKVEELNQIQKKINQIYNFLELLILANNHEFSDFHYNISSYLSSIVNRCFKRVTSFNNKTNSDEHCVNSIILNANTYRYQPYNKGNINFGNTFISGLADDFVTSYNNLKGDVYGISGLILNDNQYIPDQNGTVKITGLIDLSNGIVTSFNNSFGHISNMLSAVTSSNTIDYITYNQTNNGIINVPDIITSFFDESLYAKNGKIVLINPSADTPASTEENKMRVVTTEYIKKNFTEKIAGFNEIKIIEKYWTISGSNYSIEISIPSGISMIKIYRIIPDNPQAYTLDSTCSATIQFDTDQHIKQINLLSPDKFTGKITLFQDLHQINNSDFKFDAAGRIIGWNNPSKINHVDLPAKIKINEQQTYVNYYLKNVDHTDNVKCYGTNHFGGETNNISYLDISQSTLTSFSNESFGTIIKLSKLPSSLKNCLIVGNSINNFEEISIWNNCRYAFFSSKNYFNDIKIKDNPSLHIITGITSADNVDPTFYSLIKYGTSGNLSSEPIWYKTNDAAGEASGLLPSIQSLNVTNVTGLNWYIYCGLDDYLENPKFEISGNNITAYLYSIGQYTLTNEKISEFHLYRDPRHPFNRI